MSRSKRIVWGLVAVHFLLAIVAFCYFQFGPRHPGPSYSAIPIFTLFPSQGTLIAVWVALGKRTPLRVVLAFVGAIILWQTVCFGPFSHDILEATETFCIQVVAVSGVLLLFRITGLKLELSPIAPWAPRPFQFSILQIMTWTAAVAVIMSALRCSSAESLRRLYSMQEILLLAASLGSVGLASMWLVFGSRLPVLRVLAMLAAVGAPTVIFGVLIAHREWSYFGFIFGSEAVWIILSLLVIGWAGYRLTWHWRLRRFKDTIEANLPAPVTP